jgi:predicted AAA+ superfamily ATPase
LLPYSFPEYRAARSFAVDARLEARERQGLLLKHLDAFLIGGGFPEVVAGGADPSSYLVTLFDSILFKDIVKRHHVRQAAKLHDVGRWLIGNIAREYTCTSVKNSLACRSVHTVDNYVAYLVEAFLLMSVTRYSPKAKLRMSAPRKIYGYDTGMVNAVRFRTGRDTGRLMENMVAVELFRRSSEYYAYKTRTGQEVDFLLRCADGPDRLLQVCYDLSDPKTRRREFQALATAGSELGLSGGTVLTWDEEGTESVGGLPVELVPSWKWLLGMNKANCR